MRTSRWAGRACYAGAVALYGAACLGPAVRLGDGVLAVPGWAALLLGSLAVTELGPPSAGTLVGLSWLANPAALAGAACLASGWRTTGMVCAVAGFALGLLVFAPTSLRPQAGAYLWVGSLAVLAAGALLLWSGGAAAERPG